MQYSKLQQYCIRETVKSKLRVKFKLFPKNVLKNKRKVNRLYHPVSHIRSSLGMLM